MQDFATKADLKEEIRAVKQEIHAVKEEISGVKEDLNSVKISIEKAKLSAVTWILTGIWGPLILAGLFWVLKSKL